MKNDKKNLLIQLAVRIKNLRKERGITQEEAYNDTGIHFARIEQGKRDISYTTLCKICDYFGISLSKFFD
jgi:transcriptional regulator with XRE-family HTH domain